MTAPVENAPSAAGGVFAKACVFIRTSFASQLRRNTLAGGLTAIAGALISAISYPVYLHFLGYEQYGLWLAVSVVLSFAAFGQLGLAPAVATTVAEEYARGDLTAVRKTVSTALVAISAIGIISVLGILLCGPAIISALHLRPHLAGQATTLLPFVALLSLYVVQIDTLNAVLVGLGHFGLAQGTQQTTRLLSLLLAATLLSTGVGIISLPIASLAGYVFLHISSLVLARKITGETCFKLSAFELTRLRRLAAFGSGVLTSTLLDLLLGPLNRFAITRYIGPSSVPVYDIAFTATMQIRGVLEAGFRTLMPEASRLNTLGSEQSRLRIREISYRGIKILAGLGLPLFGTATILAPMAFKFWLGARFRPELVPAFRVLLLGGFISLLGVPGYYTLLGVRRIKHIVIAHAAQSGSNAAILGCLSYAGFLSTYSAAIATSAGLVVGGVYLLFISSSVFRRGDYRGVLFAKSTA